MSVCPSVKLVDCGHTEIVGKFPYFRILSVFMQRTLIDVRRHTKTNTAYRELFETETYRAADRGLQDRSMQRRSLSLSVSLCVCVCVSWR